VNDGAHQARHGKHDPVVKHPVLYFALYFSSYPACLALSIYPFPRCSFSIAWSMGKIAVYRKISGSFDKLLFLSACDACVTEIFCRLTEIPLLVSIDSLPCRLLRALQCLTSPRQHVPRVSANALPGVVSPSDSTTLCERRVVRRLLIPRGVLQTLIRRRSRGYRTTCIRALERTSHRPQVQRCRTWLARRRRCHRRSPRKLRVAGRRLCELWRRRVDSCLCRYVRGRVARLRRRRAMVVGGLRSRGCWSGSWLGRWRARGVHRRCRGHIPCRRSRN
jgi:hypothetical protein